MKTVTLSLQLHETAQVVRQVYSGQSLDRVLAQVNERLRPGVQSLAYHVLRHLRLAQALTNCLVSKAPPLHVQTLLWTALALCATATQADEENVKEDATRVNKQGPSYRPYVLVSQTVQAAKTNPKTRSFAALINGVLRNFLREKNKFIQQVKKQDTLAEWNFPHWWIERVRLDWPDQWEEILTHAQHAAPMTLRVNARWVDVFQAHQFLYEHEIASNIVGPYALELLNPMAVADIPGFNEGHFSVQATAAQLAAPLLLDLQWVKLRTQALGRPLKVLDACAAPGGKTAHMLEIAHQGSIDVLAMDIDASRLEKVEETLQRIGQKVQVRAADASALDAFAKDEMFDAILLDAPCTASGIVRRHPDIRWLRREDDVVELAKQQQNLLGVLWQKLAPQGRLLYCTCSLFKAEGENNTQKFVMGHNAIRRLAAHGHILPVSAISPITYEGIEENSIQISSTLQPNVATDGFYYALFEK